MITTKLLLLQSFLIQGLSLIKGKPLIPPVINNKEKEITGCDVNLTWSLQTGNPCSIPYKVRYREIKTVISDSGWREISQITDNFYVIDLPCNKEYEIAVSFDGKWESDAWSTSWRVRANSGVALFYFRLLVKIE